MIIKRRPLSYLALLLFLSICLTSCTPAAEIIVACDVGDLIDAINSANANSDTTRLILDQNCTYPITAVDNTYGGAGPNAFPQITTNVKIEGNNATLTKSKTLGNRFFFITHSGNLLLEDITLENGYPFRGDNPNSRGGAIYNDGGAFRAVRSVFIENVAKDGKGGAIYNLGLLTLEDTLFETNFSDNGGAIYNGGTMDIAALLQDVTFDRNAAYENGGAIFNASTEQGFFISGSTFENNSSYLNGGAIFSESADLEIFNSEFLENRAGVSNPLTLDWGNGGAIFSLAGDVTLNATQFNLQKAYGVGGILYSGPGTNVRLREVRSQNSTACHGGGALYTEGETEILQTSLKNSYTNSTGWNLDPWQYPMECWNHDGGAIYNTGTLVFDSSLLESTYAMGDGDGIFNTGDLIFINSTFHEDISYQFTRDAINNHGSTEVSFSTFMDSGLANSGTMTVKASVLTPYTNGCINSGTLNDLGENIALDPACPFSTILTFYGDLEIESTLSDNGGPTLTHLVRDSSPVINTSDCLSVSGNQVINDQRGIYRPHPISGTHDCDAGAFELHYTSPPPPPLPPTQIPEPSPSCEPFEGEEISLILLSLPGDTRNLPVLLRVADGIFPGFDPDGDLSNDYIAKLGDIEAYQVSQQGFLERAYFMFYIPEGAEGTAQFFELRLNNCPDPVYTKPNILIPMPIPSSSNQTGPECTVDLISPACEAAGGHMSSGVQTAPRCVCP